MAQFPYSNLWVLGAYFFTTSTMLLCGVYLTDFLVFSTMTTQGGYGTGYLIFVLIIYPHLYIYRSLAPRLKGAVGNSSLFFSTGFGFQLFTIVIYLLHEAMKIFFVFFFIKYFPVIQ